MLGEWSSVPRVLALAAVALPACTEPQPSGGSSDAGSEPSCEYTLTKYPGDCRAPPPIDPEIGVLAHYGPRSYDDPDEIAGYVMAPGYEGVDCVYSKLPNDADLHYQRYDVWSRPGTHHVILSAMLKDAPDGTHDNCELRHSGANLLGVVQGAIRGDVYHYPPDEIAEENRGLGTKLVSHQAISYELHAINSTDRPMLRENWTVFYKMPESEVTGTVGQVDFNGGLDMNIAPHSKQTITNACTLSSDLGDIRVVDLFGHMHSHGKRFSAWVARKGADAGARTLIYESYDWSELDLIEFNSVKQNPQIEYAGGKPGGMSGDLSLSPGDSIEYECAIDNTEDFALTFQAKALSGEMCNMFGSFTPGVIWTCIGF